MAVNRKEITRLCVGTLPRAIRTMFHRCNFRSQVPDADEVEDSAAAVKLMLQRGEMGPTVDWYYMCRSTARSTPLGIITVDPRAKCRPNSQVDAPVNTLSNHISKGDFRRRRGINET